MNVNETDNKRLSEITKIFDNSAITLNALAAEIVQLEIKFGTSSKIVTTKRAQLNALRLLYDSTLSYINYLRQLNHSMYSEFIAIELMRHQRASGLPISKIMALAGDSSDEWKQVDALDEKIKSIQSMLQIPEVLTPEFEQFIEILRDGSPTDI